MTFKGAVLLLVMVTGWVGVSTMSVGCGGFPPREASCKTIDDGANRLYEKAQQESAETLEPPAACLDALADCSDEDLAEIASGRSSCLLSEEGTAQEISDACPIDTDALSDACFEAMANDRWGNAAMAG